MQSNNKFLMQYSTPPGFKKTNLRIYTNQGLPDKLVSALRGPDSFFSSEERIGEERRRLGRGAAGRKRPARAFASQMPLIERERGSKTAPFTLSLPGARLGCVRHRRRTLYGVPGRFASASVPCELVSRPLAASL